MKRNLSMVLLTFILTFFITVTSSYAWKYKFIREDNESGREVLLNDAGKIDAIADGNIVIDDSSFVLKSDIPVYNLENSFNYTGNLKAGMLVGISVDKERKLTGIWVINDPENLKKIRQSEVLNSAIPE